jgi:ankyrin repeat protein
MLLTRLFTIASISLCLVSQLLAAGSDVADAAMRGDRAAIERLIRQRADVNLPQEDGATALHWAVYRGDKETADLLIPGATIAGFTFQAIDYAEGLVRVGVQSAVDRPEAAKLIRQLMQERKIPLPPADRTLNSICVVALCQGGAQ